MQQHAVPRQITTFEFKLIGFMSLKQFLYVLGGAGLGLGVFLVVRKFGIPVIDVVFAAVPVLFSLAIAFVPIQDRPMDIWFVNLIKYLRSPRRFMYRKDNRPVTMITDLYFLTNPHMTMAHIETKAKLMAYLNRNNPHYIPPVDDSHKQNIHRLLNQPMSYIQQSQPRAVDGVNPSTTTNLAAPLGSAASAQPVKPFFVGIVRNASKTPLGGIMIYVKDQNGNVMRILKTNPHGIFATFHPLPPGNYIFEVKDPTHNYFFDRSNVSIAATNQKQIEFVSREML